MRARLLFLIVAIVAVAAFSAQNWAEIMRSAPLNFGPLVMAAPLGLILLSLLGLMLLVYLISSATHRTQHLMESRQHAKVLQTQRDLAEKAEASRFTDLRQVLDAHLRETRQREAVAGTEFEKALTNSQREIRNQLEQMNRGIASRLGEMEARLEAKFDRGAVPPARRPELGRSEVA